MGASCDDGNACTSNDALDANCNCLGTPLPDGDGDGICDAQDPCDNRTIGQACNDNNPNTVNDVVGPNCACAGTLACAAADRIELIASADAELRQGTATSNFDNGGGDRLRVQKRTSGGRDQHALLKWDLSSVPANKRVTNASVVLQYFNFNGDYPMDLMLFNNSPIWTENTVTWASAPAQGAQIGARAALPRNTIWEVEATTQVQAAVDASQAFGARLTATGPEVSNANGNLAYADFDLRNGTRPTYRPKLVLCTTAKCTAGEACDDGNPNTQNDVFDADCNCAGTVGPVPFNYACTGTDEVEAIFTPVADATLNQRNPTTNYGTGNSTRAQLRAANNRSQEALIRFDVSALPANITVNQAAMDLVPFQFGETTPPLTLEMYRADNAWVETDVTWNTKPARIELITTEVDQTYNELWRTDFGGQITTARAGDQQISINIASINPENSGNFDQFLDFKSRESNDAAPILPQLRVCYVPLASLPVNWVDVFVKTVPVGAELIWKVEQDGRGDHFDVLRRGPDDADFVYVATVTQTSGTGPASYAYTDAAVAGLRPGGYLYRILQYDADGTATPSPVVVYTHRAAGGFSIAPNPANGTTYFTAAAAEPGDRYRVIDVTGRTVLRGQLDGARTEVDLSSLPAGSYHVALTGSGYELNGQVVVQ